MTEITINIPEILGFIKKFPNVDGVVPEAAIGIVKDGNIIGAVLYEGYNGSNIWMHVAGIKGEPWLTKRTLALFFHYPFVQLGCQRVSGWVQMDNSDAKQFDEHIGFEKEAVLSRAGRGGADVIVYRMFKEDCRWLPRDEA